MSQLGNIVYDEPQSGGGGGITVAGARNGLSVDGSQYIVLGQTIGQVSSPASLLNNREIPLAGFQLNILTRAGSNWQFEPGGVAVVFNPTNTGQQFAELLTIQGANPGSNPYGNFQLAWLEQNFTNPDGQIDAVLTSGYNTDGADGKRNPNEASFATVLESHFQQAGIGNGTFEWYLTTDTISGQVARHIFIVVDKVTGAATMTWTMDSLEIANTASAGAAVYATLNNQGLSMTCDPGFQLQMTTPTPAADGAFKIESQTGSGGKTRFIDESGSSAGFFQFDASAVFAGSNFCNGFANYWFLSEALIANNRAFIVQNLNVNPGDGIFTVWNNGNISTLQNARFGDNGPLPTAKVNTAPGSAAAGDGQLKLSVDAALKTVPEDGLFEYVGGVLFFTVGATRKTVTLV